MDNSLWKKVSVVGAAGKMGRGISLLLLQEMARLDVLENGSVGGGKYNLTLIDSQQEGLLNLKRFLRSQIVSHAEKNINQLREYYSRNSKLVSNKEIIEAYVEGALDIVQLSAEINSVKNSSLIFEAIHENISSKISLFKQLKEYAPEAYFLSNTSSIPISFINEKSQLQDRIIGCHFYNPPHVQRLIEIIPLKRESTLFQIVEDFCQRMKKISVISKDIAGFIGNGHFIREVCFACQKVGELSEKMPQTEAIDFINFVTQHILIRPMGIFQLIDYVGIDICQKIISIMHQFLMDPTLRAPLISQMVEREIKGGQNQNGGQKEGFFRYENLKPIEIYSLQDSKYLPLNLREFSINPLSWKELHKYSREEKFHYLNHYFDQLFQMNSSESRLAKDWLTHSKEISEKLVDDGIARSMEDVNRVLENGFFHLYGPEAPFLKKSEVGR